MIEQERGFGDLVETNNIARYRARRAHRRRIAAVHGRAGESDRPIPDESRDAGRAPRSLPSGPAPTWTGFALALGLLAVSAVVLGTVLAGYAVYGLAHRAADVVVGRHREA